MLCSSFKKYYSYRWLNLPVLVNAMTLIAAVENLAFQKESYVNSRRQYKRHIHDHSVQRGKSATGGTVQARGSSGMEQTGGGLGWTTHGCTVLDNFYVERPVWMVDLGKKTTVSGVIILTWPGNPSGKSNFVTWQFWTQLW